MCRGYDIKSDGEVPVIWAQSADAVKYADSNTPTSVSAMKLNHLMERFQLCELSRLML